VNTFQEKAICKCQDYPEKLTEWEQEFLDSISGRELLTDKQASVLNRILHKVEFE
jgi:hypothetical protein